MSTLTSVMVFMDFEFILCHGHQVQLLIVLIFMVFVSVLYMHHVVHFSACFAVSVQVAFVVWASSSDIGISIGIMRRYNWAANLRDNCCVKRCPRCCNNIQAMNMFSFVS